MTIDLNLFGLSSRQIIAENVGYCYNQWAEYGPRTVTPFWLHAPNFIAVFVEVFKITWSSIPNGADPMLLIRCLMGLVLGREQDALHGAVSLHCYHMTHCHG